MRKRKRSAHEAKNVPTLRSAADIELIEQDGRMGFENVTVNDVGWPVDDVAKVRWANKLDRDLVLNRILRAVVDAHPKAERKKGDGPKVARVHEARAALLGELVKRGRPTTVDVKVLDKIAKRYFEEYFHRRGSKVPLDPILKDILLPNHVADRLTASKIENGIKSYRKAFNEQKDWLLLRNSQMLDMPVEQSPTEKAAIEFLVHLTK